MGDSLSPGQPVSSKMPPPRSLPSLCFPVALRLRSRFCLSTCRGEIWLQSVDDDTGLCHRPHPGSSSLMPEGHWGLDIGVGFPCRAGPGPRTESCHHVSLGSGFPGAQPGGGPALNHPPTSKPGCHQSTVEILPHLQQPGHRALESNQYTQS